MRQAGAHSRKRKIHRIGRHAAPSPLEKAARQAGRVAPALALAGAIVTAPQVYHSATASPPALSTDIGAAHRSLPGTDSGPGGHVATPTLHSHGARSGDGSGSADSGGQPAKSRPAGKPRNSARPSSGKSPTSSKSAGPGQSGSQGNSGGQSHSGEHSGSGSPKASPSPSPSAPPTPAGPSCTGTTGLLPANYGPIVTYLMAHGYTGLAAAGIAGNIYQESKGNPESVGSGGGGLIGFTPLPSGYVTGNVSADLVTQLAAIVTYNQQWSQYIPALNRPAAPARRPTSTCPTSSAPASRSPAPAKPPPPP